MAEEEYTLSPTNDTEDTSSVERDINALAQKYVIPIDRIRSISSKDPSGRPNESRAHAFYRYIGFPVAADDNSFYSPGHSPPSSAIANPKNTKTFKKTVDDKFNSNTPLKIMSLWRESDFKNIRDLFGRQDLSAALYALVLRYIRPFSGILDEVNITDPFNADLQTFKLEERSAFINNFSSNNTALSEEVTAATTKLSSYLPMGKIDEGRHILKPFLVDPDIVKTVQPPENIICAPFLGSATDTKLNKNTLLQRPVIEAILRARLEGAQLSAGYFDTIKKLLTNTNTPIVDADLNSDDIRGTIAAISEDNELSVDVFNEDFKSGISAIQFETITSLIKQIKVVVEELHKATDVIDLARKEINWIPVCGVEGPEIVRGGDQYKFGTDFTEIDKQIITLKAKIFSANSSKTDWSDLGTFAGPFIGYSEEDVGKYNSNLQELENNKNKFSNDAFQALSRIELISGEVSGLGLIDILAIYAALWSMKETHLLALIDDDAFNRLNTYNPKLVNVTVTDRSSNSGAITITDALNEFEQKLVNILSFVDKEIVRLTNNPTDEDGGTLES